VISKSLILFDFGSGLPGKKKTTSPDGGFMDSFNSNGGNGHNLQYAMKNNPIQFHENKVGHYRSIPLMGYKNV
jgi:hypothetical protein